MSVGREGEVMYSLSRKKNSGPSSKLVSRIPVILEGVRC